MSALIRECLKPLFLTTNEGHFTCTLLALFCKCLTINGEGERNRALVTVVVRSGESRRRTHGNPGNAVIEGYAAPNQPLREEDRL